MNKPVAILNPTKNLGVILALVLGLAVRAAGEEINVLTALLPTTEIGSALARNTAIKIVPVGDGALHYARQARWFKVNQDKVRLLAQTAGAVISLRGVLPDDPLYLYARSGNIRVIEIDAASPLRPDSASVSVIRNKDSEILPLFWLSPSNTMKMAEHIAEDFKSLAPANEAVIEQNLIEFKQSVFDLRNHYNREFLSVPVLAVIALTSDFAYLTDDMTIEVARYFDYSDNQWDEAAIKSLQAAISDLEISTVIHQWRPPAAVVAAIEGMGAEVLVLDTVEVSSPNSKISPRLLEKAGNAYLARLFNNLDELLLSFNEQKK